MENIEDEDDIVLRGPIVRILFIGVPILCVLALTIFHIRQESEIERKFSECSFFTVATPTEMTTSHNLYFKFYYNGKNYDENTDVGAENLGLFYTKQSAMSTRYWVRVYCKDLNINRMYWDAKVPDTLQYIPKEGWKEIPYGLAEEE